MDVLDALFGSGQPDTNAPHWSDKPDASAIAVPPATDAARPGQDTDPNQRNLIAVAEDTYQEAIAPLAESDSWRGRIEGHLAAIQLMLSKEYLQPDELGYTTFNAKEYIVNRQGRRYFAVLSAGVVACQANIAGIILPFTLRAGWNPLNLPDGAAITTITGSATVAIRLSNWVQRDDNNLNPSDVATALLNAPANTNSASDTPLTFASPVQHWTLQNNSAAILYYNLDAAATTGSLTLQPGAQAFYDWPVTAVHVYTASAIPVNASGGLALVGRL